MWHQHKLLSKCCLVILLVLGAVSFATAQTDEPDPTPQAFSNHFGSIIGGAVDLFPGNLSCSPVVGVSQFILFRADVIPNKGNPSPKTLIFFSPDDPNLGDATRILKTRATGPGVLNNTYTSRGFYQVCFKYPAGQAQGPPGDAFDFIFVNLQIQFN